MLNQYGVPWLINIEVGALLPNGPLDRTTDIEVFEHSIARARLLDYPDSRVDKSLVWLVEQVRIYHPGQTRQIYNRMFPWTSGSRLFHASSLETMLVAVKIDNTRSSRGVFSCHAVRASRRVPTTPWYQIQMGWMKRHCVS